MSVNGFIHSVETAGALDGPGLRYVLFMSGCPFRCAFCHNPDTWGAKPKKNVTAKDACRDILKYADFFKFTGGGVTLSGGEPLLQPEFVCELLKNLKNFSIHSAIDTCGAIALSKEVVRAVRFCDLVMLDIKHVDTLEHEKITGQPQGTVLEFLKFLEAEKKRYWIRCVLIADLTATEIYAKKLAQFLKFNAPNAELVELLPYHNMGVEKWKALGLEYRLNSARAPSISETETFANILNCSGIKTKFSR